VKVVLAGPGQVDVDAFAHQTAGCESALPGIYGL
jgi:hypothetical protein